MAFFERLSAMAKAASSKASVLARDAADKASELAKTAADKASTAIEVGKLNSQIRNENDRIAMAKSQMGHLIWERFSAGEALDAELQSQCQKIVVALCNIDALNDQIEALKAEDNQPEAAEAEIVEEVEAAEAIEDEIVVEIFDEEEAAAEEAEEKTEDQ
ncbi:MAG: hypothetical protein IKT90_04615 [Clostridia bacterium]|nr:hypothetical protein [Clostridia bacterium]